ncbi:hypothetical protein [Nocardia sp. CNY236]|uniref:hypothetical protein n=1 Tax=Nocardia sp. CNY236 TaxID=1169152 RepID=UPI00040D5E82|nr:hypothetical protein [Nocardia sp. CNY236]
MAVSWQGRTIDAILDEGSPGLRYWVEFMPLYQAAFGGTEDLETVLARYDEQRGMRVEKFEYTGQLLKGALTEADTQWRAQRSYTSRLPGVWQGTAATAALGMLNEQSLLAEADRQHAWDAWKAIDPMANSLRYAVGAKAEVVLGLLEDAEDGRKVVTIGGKSAADVRVLVEVHHAQDWISGSHVRDLRRIFPALDEFGDHDGDKQSLTDAYGEMIRGTVDAWLRSPFKQDFEAKLSRYMDACQLTDDHFTLQYQNLTGALAAVFERDYPRPLPTTHTSGYEGAEIPAAPTRSGWSSSLVTSADHVPSSLPADLASTAPTMSTPFGRSLPFVDGLAGLERGGDGLPSSTTSLTQTVGRAITVLGGMVRDGIDDVIDGLGSGSVGLSADAASGRSSSTTPAESMPASLSPSSPMSVSTVPTQSLEGSAEFGGDAGRSPALATSSAHSSDDDAAALGATVEHEIDGAVEEHAAVLDSNSRYDTGADGLLAEQERLGGSKAEFEIGGKRATFGSGSDGQVTLVLSDGAGQSQEFELDLDEEGMPVISRSEPALPPHAPIGIGQGNLVPGRPVPDQPVPDPDESGETLPTAEQGTADSAQRNETPPSGGNDAPPVASVDSPPPRNPDVERERRAEPVPPERTSKPADPPDTGAELAEAGPL